MPGDLVGCLVGRVGDAVGLLLGCDDDVIGICVGLEVLGDCVGFEVEVTGVCCEPPRLLHRLRLQYLHHPVRRPGLLHRVCRPTRLHFKRHPAPQRFLHISPRKVLQHPLIRLLPCLLQNRRPLRLQCQLSVPPSHRLLPESKLHQHLFG